MCLKVFIIEKKIVDLLFKRENLYTHEMIILIILAVVATFGLAYLIVNYLPLKYKWIVSIVLAPVLGMFF